MKFLVFLIGLLMLLTFPSPAQAVCPICTLVVAGGLGVSHWLCIDDTVTGIWIGGLILSSALWLADWIGKKRWRVPYKEVVSTLLMVLFIIPPLYWAKMIGCNDNTLWGIDKVLLGTVVGSLIFLLGVGLDTWLRTTNDGKVYIYYQKVIIPVFLLSLISFVFYLITG
jgi:hypothetical protein